MSAGHQKALDWLKSGPKRLLIGGQWVEAVSGRTFDTSNPATEETLTTVAEADSADIDKAAIAA
ncbi:betaine-aldehyde dehydrogenase, partial [Bacillus sp. SIMBA_026]